MRRQREGPEPDTDGHWVEDLFTTAGHDVYLYAARRVGPDLADDIVAETFAVAWRRREEFAGDPRPWLFGVARRIIAGSRRVQQATATISLDQLSAMLADQATANVTDFTDVSNQRRDLMAALSILSETDREVLLLSTWQDLSAAQAARVLSCSTTAYNVRLHRARKHLRQIFPGRAEAVGAPLPLETS